MNAWERYWEQVDEDELVKGAHCPRCGETVAMHSEQEIRFCADRYNVAHPTVSAAELRQREIDRAMRFGLTGRQS